MAISDSTISDSTISDRARRFVCVRIRLDHLRDRRAGGGVRDRGVRLARALARLTIDDRRLTVARFAFSRSNPVDDERARRARRGYGGERFSFLLARETREERRDLVDGRRRRFRAARTRGRVSRRSAVSVRRHVPFKIGRRDENTRAPVARVPETIAIALGRRGFGFRVVRGGRPDSRRHLGGVFGGRGGGDAFVVEERLRNAARLVARRRRRRRGRGRRGRVDRVDRDGSRFHRRVRSVGVDVGGRRVDNLDRAFHEAVNEAPVVEIPARLERVLPRLPG